MSIALARRDFDDGRVRTVAFSALFASMAYLQVVAYAHSYPTRADRLAFAHTYSGNAAIRLFYGQPHDLLTVGGYTAWRVGGTLAVFAAVWGLLAAVRALRGEEDAGRSEIVLAGPTSRGSMLHSAASATLAGAAMLWVATCGGLLLGGLPAGGSAYLALALCTPLFVFAAAGTLISQLTASRRTALELGAAVIGAAFLLRAVADTTGNGWLRLLTPLGWAESLRPFTGSRPAVLLLPLAATGVLLALAWRLALRRDIGTGVLAGRDRVAPRLRLLGSPLAQAFRAERGSLLVWALSLGTYAAVAGIVSRTISAKGIPESLRREFAKLGTSVFTPKGYVSFSFSLFVFALSLFACAQLGAARHEESEGRLETVCALPVGRAAWLRGRLLLACVGATALALLASVVTWAGAASQGVSVSLPSLLGAGANCLPATALFIGLAALAFAALPRAGGAVSYAVVIGAFLWSLIGSLLGVPHWLTTLTPFAHVALVPSQPFRTMPALLMLGGAAVASAAALAIFSRRDLTGA